MIPTGKSRRSSQITCPERHKSGTLRANPKVRTKAENRLVDMRQTVSYEEFGEVANKIMKAGFSVGWVSAVDSEGRTIWIVDARRDGKRFVVHADEKLMALLELERAVCLALLSEQT